MTGRDGFGAALRAEWTKLRTVRRWMITLFGAAVLIVSVGLLAASSSGTDANRYPNFVTGPDGDPVTDEFTFVHQPIAGDGTITARVAVQRDSGPDAGAGLIIKANLQSGSRYVAVRVTPGRGVHLQADFKTDVQGSSRTAPVWLRLTRQGGIVTAYESADGAAWSKVGQVKASALPRDAQIGFFVSSPPKVTIERQAGSTAVGETQTLGTATFDNVRLDAAATGDWSDDALVMQLALPGPPDGKGPNEKAGRGEPEEQPPLLVQRDGTFAVTGRGDIGPKAPDDDVVSLALFGVLVGFMALVAVGVLFVTSEYRRGMIRTTFAATPRRGRTLAAKAVVMGAAAYVVGLAGGAVALLVAQPAMQKKGFGPPAFPAYSLTDWPVLRALLLTSLFLALLTVFSLALGAIVRHSATAITTVIMLVVLPVILASILPLSAARWLMLLTPAGGLATWRAKPRTETLVEPWSTITPGAGLAVVSVYAAVSLAFAWWLMRRRDA